MCCVLRRPLNSAGSSGDRRVSLTDKAISAFLLAVLVWNCGASMPCNQCVPNRVCLQYSRRVLVLCCPLSSHVFLTSDSSGMWLTLCLGNSYQLLRPYFLSSMRLGGWWVQAASSLSRRRCLWPPCLAFPLSPILPQPDLGLPVLFLCVGHNKYL